MTARKRIPRHRHKFQRLSDEALFCECGETKDVRPQPVHYHLCSSFCTHTWRNYPTYPLTTWTDTTANDIYTFANDTSTFTVTS